MRNDRLAPASRSSRFVFDAIRARHFEPLDRGTDSSVFLMCFLCIRIRLENRIQKKYWWIHAVAEIQNENDTE